MKEAFYDWWGLNDWLFLLINGASGKSFDDIMQFFTDLGDYKNFKFYVLVVALFLITRLAYMRYKLKEVVDGVEVRRSVASLITLMMGFALNGMMVGVTRMIIHLPRPFVEFRKPGEMHYVGPASPDPSVFYSTFPSPHAAAITFVVACVWPKLNIYGRVFCSMVVVMVCMSRIALGWHYPADLVVGAGIGVLAAWITRRYVNRMMRLA